MPGANAAAGGRPTKEYPTIGACGLDCGLCPRYYTVGPSRCPGCAGRGFSDKHPTCGFITCCVKDRQLDVCAECPEFPCARVESASEKAAANESPSYPTAKRMMPNLLFIREHGLGRFVREQTERIRVLEGMLEEFDDGRSKGFFCKAAGRYEPELLRAAVSRARRTVEAEGLGPDERKGRAAVLRALIQAIPEADQR